VRIDADIKPDPERRLIIAALRAMTPERRLERAFELSRFARDLFRAGLKRRFPALDDDAFEALYRERLLKCHNRDW